MPILPYIIFSYTYRFTYLSFKFIIRSQAVILYICMACCTDAQWAKLLKKIVKPYKLNLPFWFLCATFLKIIHFFTIYEKFTLFSIERYSTFQLTKVVRSEF